MSDPLQPRKIPSGRRPPTGGGEIVTRSPEGPWRGAALLLLVLSVAAVLVLTLRPAGPGSALGVPPLCLTCGDAPLANAVRNVVLFLPAGIALGLLVGRVLPVALAALALTLGIETAQLFIPGRNPLLVDVLANGSGGALGGWIGIHLPRLVSPPARVARRLAPGSAILACLLLLLSGWLLSPAPPSRELAVSLAPLGPPPAEAEPTTADPRPRILQARIGSEELAHGPHPDTPRLAAGVRALLRPPTGPAGGVDPQVPAATGTTLVLDFLPGPPVPPGRHEPARTTLFRIHSGADGREALRVHLLPSGGLAVSPPSRSRAFGLDHPRLHWADALAGLDPADPVRLVLRSATGQDGDPSGGTRQGWCVELALPGTGAGATRSPAPTAPTDPRIRCRRAPDPTLGWSLLLWPPMSGRAEVLLGTLFLLGLLLPAAWWSPGRGMAAGTLLAPGAILLLLPLLLPGIALPHPATWIAFGAAGAAALPRGQSRSRSTGRSTGQT